MTKIKDNDLIGSKFGRLTVLERVDIKDKNNRNKIYYKCVCDCDTTKTKTILKGSLINGDTLSCGCLRKEKISKLNSQDLMGMKFERLTVVRKVKKPENRNNRGNYWLCECDCGSNKQIIASTSELNSGNTRSCGCLSIERIIVYNKETKKKYNTYDLSGEYGIGYTSKGEEFYFDLEDYDKIKDICWMINNRGYVSYTKRENKYKANHILMHRFILDCPQDMEVDHKNGKPSRNDNRRNNMRICSHQKNMCNYTKPKNNTSGVKGVSWDKTYEVWKAYITSNKQRINLGSFNDFNKAVKARKDAEDKYHGEYKSLLV